ncbi:MAG: hypothetical protein JKY19_11095 [Alcanivoracaceae bacterium]|nr:hypothetical protein [Alcanivoracaceae bacterium]
MKLFHIKYMLMSLMLSMSFLLMAEINTPQSILNLKVISNGIYRVQYTDIINLGVDLTGVNLTNISVMHNGVNVPVKIVSANQITFDQNSYIEFVGISAKNLYQEGSIYSLVLDENILITDSGITPQQNQQTVAYYLHKEKYANNNDYSFGAPIDDPWFAKRMLAIGSEVTETLDFDINNLLTQADVQIEMNIWGGTDYLQSPDHHVIYEVNGSVVDDFRFDGITSDIREYNIDSNMLTDGTQQIVVKVPNDTNTSADVIHIESWNITYPRAFVLSNKQLNFESSEGAKNSGLDVIFKQGFENEIKHYSVRNANNENYIIYKLSPEGNVDSINSLHSNNCNINVNDSCTLSFSLESSSGYVYISAESEIKVPELSLPVILTDIKQGSAEYLIITHPDFIGDELNLFAELKQLTYTVKIVDVEQIYAQYGYGNVSAKSIADYIKYAASSLTVKNVLLVGGDTYDYKNYLGLNSVSFIPTLYGRTDDLITYAPIDAKFADIDGDNIPDINIGRFPVRTENELANLRLKILAYSNKDYNKTAVFAADKFDVSNVYSFKNDAEFLIGQLPIQWQSNITASNKAFVDDDGVALAKSKIIDNINQGVALTSFIGHSGPRDWSFSRMFSASDANLLINSNAPTLVTQWGCWNTYFVSPTEDTLAHAFMLNQNGGAASVLGASTLTKAEHEKGLAQLVLTFLTHDEMTLGDAVTQAKRIYAQTNPDALDVILGWNILGDPGLKL